MLNFKNEPPQFFILPHQDPMIHDVTNIRTFDRMIRKENFHNGWGIGMVRLVNMRDFLATFSLLLGFFLPISASAAPGWITTTTINELISAENGLSIIVHSGSNPVPCGSPDWYRLLPSVPNYQATAAAIISAKAQGKPIQLWANTCDTDGASLVVAVWIKN